MTSQFPTLQPKKEGTLSFSIWLALLTIFTATGIVLRQVAIPTFSPYVTLTPGFITPLLTGLILGPLAGIICGTFVGISGAPWELFLIPLLGNIALGLSTGIPSYFRHKLPPNIWMSLCIISAIIIGGFMPTFGVEVLIIAISPIGAAITASIDAAQAGVWVIVALLLTVNIIDPILRRFRSPKNTVSKG